MIITNKKQLIIKCDPISLLEANEIINKLKIELDKTNGIGLAAPQIGINKRVAIIKVKEFIALVNPIIKNQYDLKEFHQEGCLSFPDKWIKTQRFNEIVAYDLLNPSGIIVTGLEAVAFQHEIGHLNGKLMYDYEIKIPGRNEKCWCKSGKKYKKCHLNKVIK